MERFVRACVRLQGYETLIEHARIAFLWADRRLFAELT